MKANLKKLAKNISVILCFSLILSFLFLSRKTITTNALEENQIYTVTATVNVRTGPGINYKSIGTIKKGSTVDVVEIKNNWCKINYNDSTAYISAKYVKVEQTEVDSEKEFALELFNKINEHRKSIGVNELTWNDKLYEVAKVRAEEIYTLWSHTRPNGKDPGSAFDELNVDYMKAAENLLKNADTVDEAFDAWYKSDGHRKSMENGNYSKSAIYIYIGPDGKRYMAQEFTD